MVKIFIGGVKLKHTDKFKRRWPYQQFEFATEDESWAQWNRKAKRCEHYVVYQHRTTHRHIEGLARCGIIPHFSDSTPIVMQIIEDFVTKGKTDHSYTKEHA